jgi:trans-aconitate methyltransferase
LGVDIILERFGAAHVTGIDGDRDMIARARRRLRRFSATGLRPVGGTGASVVAG